jgi:Domain of unknown function (DUF4258)
LDAGQATERIRAIARHELFCPSYKIHAKDQLRERGLIISDLIYLLQNGFVYDRPEEATRPPYWRYQMQCTTPNSKNREVRVVVIPDRQRKGIKFVTVMWVDEAVIRGG